MASKTVSSIVKDRTGAAQDASSVGECFTIMPFGGYFDEYYAKIYRPAIEQAGLTACRVDDLYRPSVIIHDIWNYAKNCKLLLADLTGRNPNVFYELGLAHALAKPAILVAESVADVPFDLRSLRVLEYNKNQPMWAGDLQIAITKAIHEVIASPLRAVLPSFLEVAEAPRASVSEQQKELLAIHQELTSLRYEISRIGSVSSPDKRNSETDSFGWSPSSGRLRPF